MSGRKIAWKSVNDPPNQAPTLIGGIVGGVSYTEICFCDWTEQGQILANANRSGTWKLTIFDRSGRMVRELPTIMPPAAGVIASWRKYNHK